MAHVISENFENFFPDSTDLALIERLQDGLPLQENPFADISQELNLSEQEIINRLDQLLRHQFLSRFGPMYNADYMGGQFILAAMHVPQSELDYVTQLLNSIKEVAHNYQREHLLNMWFVLGSDKIDQIYAAIEEIKEKSKLQVYAFPKIKEYFVKLRLKLSN